MNWTNILSGPYMDTLWELLGPKYDASTNTYVFAAPIHDGAQPMIYLVDLAKYVLWTFNHPDESAGLTFGASTEHVSWTALAESFTKVTGKKAVYKDIELDQWIDEKFSHSGPQGPETKIGSAGGWDDESLLTCRQNFSKWWELYRESGGNQGILKRDYEFLDRILPDRVKSVEEWMKIVGFDGSERKMLKMTALKQNRH